MILKRTVYRDLARHKSFPRIQCVSRLLHGPTTVGTSKGKTYDSFDFKPDKKSKVVVVDLSDRNLLPDRSQSSAKSVIETRTQISFSDEGTIDITPLNAVESDEVELIDIESVEKSKPRPSDRNTGALSRGLQNTRDLINRHSDCVLLVEMGSFYELYFEQAEKYGPMLGLKVAMKQTKNHQVAMAGFPSAKINKYIKILVKEYGLKVGIVDQFRKETVNPGDNLMDRKIVRIITPGTVINDAFRNFHQNNFLLAIHFLPRVTSGAIDLDTKVGLAWADVSLGKFYCNETTVRDLMTAIATISPSEIVLDDKFKNLNLESGELFKDFAGFRKYFMKYQILSDKSMEDYFQMFAEDAKSLRREFNEFRRFELSSTLAILQYVSETLPGVEMNFETPVRHQSMHRLQIDPRTSEALELKKSVRENSAKGSLLSVIKKTVTPSGTRLLTDWITSPSTQRKEIVERQRHVEIFKSHFLMASRVINQIKATGDILRLVQRLNLRIGNARDLYDIATSLESVQAIKNILSEDPKAKKAMAGVISNLDSHEDLARAILDKFDKEEFEVIESLEEEILIDDEGDNEVGNQGIYEKKSVENKDYSSFLLRKDSSKELADYHNQYQSMIKERDILISTYERILKNLFAKSQLNIQIKEHIRYGVCLYVRSLRQTKESLQTQLGKQFTVHVKNTTAAWITTEEWDDLMKRIQGITNAIAEEEKRVIRDLESRVKDNLKSIRGVARSIDYLDVISSFAVIANEKDLVRPIVDDSTDLEVVNGRHLVVEEALQSRAENFVPNSTSLLAENHVWVVSGPNTGGKSTFLRQNALMVILAQMGCFVPAKSARIGIVDKIFSRVGAADDLYRDLSTFMVEMIETSFILKTATNRSLAILDEVGRGTSGREGLAIAYATLNHICSVNDCRTLFATHFGLEINELLQDSVVRPKVQFHRTKISTSMKNSGETVISFDHKIEPGISEKSHAIVVAELAGFPEEAIEVAKKSLEDITKACLY